jgi:hypothetical protein
MEPPDGCIMQCLIHLNKVFEEDMIDNVNKLVKKNIHKSYGLRSRSKYWWSMRLVGSYMFQMSCQHEKGLSLLSGRMPLEQRKV